MAIVLASYPFKPATQIFGGLAPACDASLAVWGAPEAELGRSQARIVAVIGPLGAALAVLCDGSTAFIPAGALPKGCGRLQPGQTVFYTRRQIFLRPACGVAWQLPLVWLAG